jgi:rhodanese-related sulfurtransferase
MSVPLSVPGITPSELAARLQTGEHVWLLDVREPYEWSLAYLNLPGLVTAPLSELAALGTAALPKETQDQQAAIVVFCHVGERSRMVTTWLQSQGWTNVLNLKGGIDAYARQIDPHVGIY